MVRRFNDAVVQTSDSRGHVDSVAEIDTPESGSDERLIKCDDDCDQLDTGEMHGEAEVSGSQSLAAKGRCGGAPRAISGTIRVPASWSKASTEMPTPAQVDGDLDTAQLQVPCDHEEAHWRPEDRRPFDFCVMSSRWRDRRGRYTKAPEDVIPKAVKEPPLSVTARLDHAADVTPLPKSVKEPPLSV